MENQNTRLLTEMMIEMTNSIMMVALLLFSCTNLPLEVEWRWILVGHSFVLLKKSLYVRIIIFFFVFLFYIFGKHKKRSVAKYIVVNTFFLI